MDKDGANEKKEEELTEVARKFQSSSRSLRESLAEYTDGLKKSFAEFKADQNDRLPKSDI
jgi:hypothetical protein